MENKFCLKSRKELDEIRKQKAEVKKQISEISDKLAYKAVKKRDDQLYNAQMKSDIGRPETMATLKDAEDKHARALRLRKANRKVAGMPESRINETDKRLVVPNRPRLKSLADDIVDLGVETAKSVGHALTGDIFRKRRKPIVSEKAKLYTNIAEVPDNEPIATGWKNDDNSYGVHVFKNKKGRLQDAETIKNLDNRRFKTRQDAKKYTLKKGYNVYKTVSKLPKFETLENKNFTASEALQESRKILEDYLEDDELYYGYLSGVEAEIAMTGSQVKDICTSGLNDEAVKSVVNDPMIKEQLAKISDEQLNNLSWWLADYTDEEIRNMSRETKEEYVVWLTAWNIFEDDQEDFSENENYTKRAKSRKILGEISNETVRKVENAREKNVRNWKDDEKYYWKEYKNARNTLDRLDKNAQTFHDLHRPEYLRAEQDLRFYDRYWDNARTQLKKAEDKLHNFKRLDMGRYMRIHSANEALELSKKYLCEISDELADRVKTQRQKNYAKATREWKKVARENPGVFETPEQIDKWNKALNRARRLRENYLEDKAAKIGNDKELLLKRLKDAKSVLKDEYLKEFKDYEYDFDNKALHSKTSDLSLIWTNNGRTSEGSVSLHRRKNAPKHESKINEAISKEELYNVKDIVDYLLAHNKNYTKAQYYKLLDLEEIINKIQIDESKINENVFYFDDRTEKIVAEKPKNSHTEIKTNKSLEQFKDDFDKAREEGNSIADSIEWAK